ncbi:hypothetical protein Scep_026262 [Stephania cephalantha]|uniref:Uncharacterized protein n=1 Tax=Stephania cephalantha TaxID=152367 RepID=A0AAP0ES18_9MAGN
MNAARKSSSSFSVYVDHTTDSTGEALPNQPNLEEGEDLVFGRRRRGREVGERGEKEIEESDYCDSIREQLRLNQKCGAKWIGGDIVHDEVEGEHRKVVESNSVQPTSREDQHVTNND